MTTDFMQGWIPYKITVDDGEALCHWIDTGNQAFSEPFFQETLGKIKGMARHRFFFNSVSGLTLLEEWAEAVDYVEPTAFIFHISRCGSTLISQLLSLDEQNVSLSEVPVFDNILRLKYKLPGITDEHTSRLFKAAIKFYGQKRTGSEKYLFIKTDSWHVHFHKQLRALYPDTPFILLYRAPDKVFESHGNLRGIQMVPGLIEPGIFGFDEDEIPDFFIHPANVITSFLKKYIDIASKDKLSLLLNYNEGMITIMDKIASFCNIAFSMGLRQKMLQRTAYHSKYPDQVFTEQRNMPAPPYLQEATELYDKVEVLRSITARVNLDMS